jgi:hypothetical protein
MSRLGVANFYRSGSTPNRNDAIWRETVLAEQNPHPFSSFYRKVLEPETRPSEMRDAFAKTWAIIKQHNLNHPDTSRSCSNSARAILPRTRRVIRTVSEIPSFKRIIT